MARRSDHAIGNRAESYATPTKNTGKGNLFVIFGQPDIDLLTDPEGKLRVKINGVDVFHPNLGDEVMKVFRVREVQP